MRSFMFALVMVTVLPPVLAQSGKIHHPPPVLELDKEKFKKFAPVQRANIIHLKCDGDGLGKIELILNPAYSGLTFKWTRNGQSIPLTASTIGNLVPGIYQVTITGTLNSGGFVSLATVNYTYFVGYHVLYTDLAGGATVSGTTVEKLGAVPLQGGFASRNKLNPYVDGFVWFEINDPSQLVADKYIGLSEQNTDENFNTINYAFRIFNEELYIIQNGVIVPGPRANLSFRKLLKGDQFAIRRSGSATAATVQVDFYHNNGVIHTSTTSPDPSRSMIIDGSLQVDNSLFRDVITSFFCPVPPVYAELTKGLNGGIYRTYDNILYFKYRERYRDGELLYRIYDQNMQVIYSYADQVLPKDIGDNWYSQIDVSTDPDFVKNDYYILEVENDKGHKEKLRFVYK